MSNNQSGLIDIAELTYIDPSKNSNKFYRMIIRNSGDGSISFESHWGRIGSSGSIKEKKFFCLDRARKEMNTLVGQKVRKGYKINNIIIEDITLEEWNLRERQKEARRHIKEGLLKL